MDAPRLWGWGQSAGLLSLLFRKKVIGLDDLLLDFFETGKDERRRKAKGAKSNTHDSRGYGSDDDDSRVKENEISFCKIFEVCQEEVIFSPHKPH